MVPEAPQGVVYHAPTLAGGQAPGPANTHVAAEVDAGRDAAHPLGDIRFDEVHVIARTGIGAQHQRGMGPGGLGQVFDGRGNTAAALNQ